MLVLSNARPGTDEEFNAWYDQHMVDTVEKLDGFATGQRFAVSTLTGAPESPFRYLAVYEVEGDRVERALEQFHQGRAERAEAAAAGRPPMISVSDTLDPTSFVVGFYSSTTDLVTASRLVGDA